MHGICKPFQVNFHVLPFKNLQNTSRFVTLLLAHGDVVIGLAIFHIAYSKNKKIKKIKKGTPPWNVNVGGHPMESVSHGLRKEKRRGGVPSFIKEHKKCQSLSQKLASILYGR
jgi:hypothetical protein